MAGTLIPPSQVVPFPQRRSPGLALITSSASGGLYEMNSVRLSLRKILTWDWNKECTRYIQFHSEWKRHIYTSDKNNNKVSIRCIPIIRSKKDKCVSFYSSSTQNFQNFSYPPVHFSLFWKSHRLMELTLNLIGHTYQGISKISKQCRTCKLLACKLWMVDMVEC